ncbi:MAG: 16S rRNA processing protein RimM [Proteobacteria bacterium]|nr:16S rRNA processing protein RimM [Pseudomonadota bacterium]
MTPVSSQTPSFFCAAAIASAHGVHGHVKVKCFLEDPSQFKFFSPFYNEKGEETFKVKKVLSQDKDVLIVSLEGISDRNQAELVKGSQLMVPQASLPKLSSDTFYHQDLIGLSVKSTQGNVLGTVHALYNFGAGDLLEIKTLDGKLEMVPFTREAVPDVKQKEGFLLLSEAGSSFLKGDSHAS